MLAIEKGMELPMEEKKKKNPKVSFLNWGLIVGFMGLGLFLSVLIVAGIQSALATVFIIFLGVAFLLISLLYKEEDKDDGDHDK